MLKKVLELSFQFLNSNKYLKPFKPILTAFDAAMYGTEKLTVHMPHILDRIDIKRFMFMVVVGLLPVTAASVYFFGFRVIEIIIVSYVFGGAVEVVFAILRKKEIEEGFLVTGLIFALTLPPTVPLWVTAVGIVFGTFFGKEVFGGTGRNIFNPALVGRLFITLAFPSIMSLTWEQPITHGVTSATPLMLYKESHIMPGFTDLLFGNTAGCLGETFRIGLLAGGILLIVMKISNWRIPVSYLLSVFAVSYIGNTIIPGKIAPPVFQLLSGGLLLGAFFMATDPVTTPFTKPGKYIFGIFCGLLTVIIRSFSGYTEGVMFSIVLMNTFTPLIDNTVLLTKYKPIKK